jgi:hypothetical protein
MLTSWANHAVIAALGLGIGMMLSILGLIAPPEFERAGKTRQPGEGFLDRVRRRQAEEQAAVTTQMKEAAGALYAFVVVLVLVVWLSPVELGWWTLLISAFLGFLFVGAVYWLARARKLPLGLFSRFDPVPTPRDGTPPVTPGSA